MNRFSKSLAATFLSAAMLFSSAAQAMEIQQFDKMAQDDQAEYVSALIQDAEKVLTDEGRADQAAQVSHLFTTNAPGANISIGMAEFMRNLARLRVADVENVQKNPKDVAAKNRRSARLAAGFGPCIGFACMSRPFISNLWTN